MRTHPFMAATLALACSPALAAEEIRAPVLSQEERNYLAEESRLLRELRIAELQAKVDEAKGKSRQDSGGRSAPDLAQLLGSTPVPPAPVAPISAPAPASESATKGPRFAVLSVYGLGQALVADIAVDGAVYSRRTGDSLPGGWKVKHVDAYGAVLVNGKMTKTMKVGGGS